jgi:glycerol-3-phosphate acyltransferase PlsY
MIAAIILVGLAYLVGSLPFGLWLTRAEGVDLRAHGSGNIGATNVWRASGRLMAAVVLALDAGKGAFAVLVARVVVDDVRTMVACALAVVVGHVWPVWADFRGGRGVATAAGAYGSLVPVTLVWEAMAFGLAVATTRYVSVASMLAAALLPCVTLLVDGRPAVTMGALVLAVLVIWRHRTNIERLWLGTEPRLGSHSVAGRRRAPFAE